MEFYDKEADILKWHQKRQKREANKRWRVPLYTHLFNLKTLYSFAQNFNVAVIFHMFLAAVCVYVFEKLHLSFDMNAALVVSPIVFPLAFSINTDFQRREKVLEDLAQFKSCGMMWYYCMRDWKQPAALTDQWMDKVDTMLKRLLFHLREYLLTEHTERRKVILSAIYDDFSDSSRLIETLRASKLPYNTAIVSKCIHLVRVMCLSFERLRVVREYRSPRSIRAFNKFLIMLLPVVLSPYFVHVAKEAVKENDGAEDVCTKWIPYFMSVFVAFVFSALQVRLTFDFSSVLGFHLFFDLRKFMRRSKLNFVF